MLRFYFFSFIAGSINGLLGQGGGMIMLPVLYKYLENEKEAHGSVAMFILPLTIVSAVIYNKKIESDTLVLVCLGACIGGIIGFFLNKKLSSKSLKLIFGITILYLGLKQIC